MKDNKEKWIADVFDSMKGSRRSKPSADLFAKIEHQLDAPEARVIPINQWKLTAVAAVLLLIMNVFVLRQVTQNNGFGTGETMVEHTSEQLISNYKIYD